ncbi:DNA polymerase-3 subunit gamma/tau [Alkalihalobacillus xiaoxiensis]|uniref:DNA-directed DNA polymerase n=1 Tax=Shouchella xiaoxiensis TaxID=766895 RepID=A0ABS2T1V8_9BACI|nr:DNA polymerase III subunit gamma/tau [Shouchella xiaoxiensis]MBM7841241.1 DNA polymerase-3 subunit gamma/tau [Shouchella xiaoxiensis]
MSYQALYRVWRPQLLQDVVGQTHITKTLQNALIQEKMAHAYLFSGPRGTGKTSAAKIVAKAVNCEEAPTNEPCNICKSCIGITEGSIVDVIEIDAASNNGVDEIRDIRDKVKYAPTEVAYKVYIIDEVHMLSTGAFNALLKTLEEPPAHVIFILATTEPHKIPLTILSRCQRFDFKPISNEELVSRMTLILDKNNQLYEEDALKLIAQAADGGMRDALSLLDQAISFSEEKVAINDVLTITGAVSHEALNTLVAALAQKNARLSLETIDETLKNGKDPKRLLEDMILYFRDLLLYKAAPEVDGLFERAKLNDSFKQLADQFQLNDLQESMQILNESQQEIKWAAKPKIVLEMAVVQLMAVTPKVQQESVNNQQWDQLKLQIKQLEEKLANLSQRPVQVQPVSNEPNETQKTQRRRVSNQGGKGRVGSTAAMKDVLDQADKNSLQETTSKWGSVMEQVKATSVPAHAWLNDCKPVAASKTKVLLAFQNEMHRDMMDTKFREVLSQVLQQVFGERSEFVTLLNRQWEQLKEEYVKGQQNDQDQTEKSDPLIDEAVKLVGEDLIEIIDS